MRRMNLSKKIVSICKTMQHEDLLSAVDAGALRLCTKCMKFKKVMIMVKVNIGVRYEKFNNENT